MKQRLWRDAMFDSELKGDARKEYDIEVMNKLYGSASSMDAKWRDWLAARKSTFHYIDWGWEQSGDTLWSYGWPGWGRYAQTDIRLPLNEKPGKRKWVMDYPQTALPSPLIGKVQRGIQEPSVGAIISFSRSHDGKAGLGFGVHGEGDKKESQKYLAVVIQSGNDFNRLSLVLEGSTLGLPDQQSQLPEAFVNAARDTGYKIGMTVKMANERVEVVLRAGDEPLTFSASMMTTSVQHQQLISEPWAVLSRDGKHGLTIYPDVIREHVDVSIAAPLGRYRFGGQEQLYGLYRAAWRLGGSSPDTLLALKKKMTAALDKDAATQKAAMDLYRKYIMRVATDVSRTADSETAAYALADILGLSLSLELDRDSTSSHPAVAAYLRSGQTESLKASITVLSPREAKAPPQTVAVKKGRAARIDIRLGSRPAPYSAFLIRVEGTIKWHGLTAKVRADTAGNPTIPCWWVAGPFDNRGNDRIDNTPLIKDVNISRPVTAKDGAEVQWQKVMRTSDSLVGSEVVPDFNRMLGDLKDVSAYSVAYFDCPTARDAELQIGSDDGVIVWLNGKCVHINMVARGYDSGQDQAPLHLQAGRNTLLVETTQSWGGWKMGAHLLDTQGKPFNDIKFITE